MSAFSLKENKSPFSKKNKVARLIWWLCSPLFFATPYWLLNGFRISILRMFGAKIGIGCVVYPSAKIWAPWNLYMGNYSCIGPNADIYSMGQIIIGSHVTISQHAVLCTGTHDISTPHNDLVIKNIEIDDHSWICAYAKIMPGVKISKGSIIGMASLLTKDTQAWGVYGGNPAKQLKTREIHSD